MPPLYSEQVGRAGNAPAHRIWDVTRSSSLMEPRPPQPRSPRPFETPGSPETAGIGERLYPAPGEPAYYPSADAYASGAAAEPPLLPRRQRRQRGALRGIAAAVVAIAAIAALGWFFRDAVRGIVAPPEPSPTAEAEAIAPGTPTAAAESAALPNALATVTPTPEAAATAAPETEAESGGASIPASEPEAAEAGGDVSVQTLPLLELLPLQEEVPAGLELVNEAERSKAEVIQSLGGTDEAALLLDDWGWSGNAYRDFVADDTAVPPGGTNFLNVSVHRFADAESAANALTVYSDQVIFAQGLQEVESPAIGENARLLVGESDEVTLSVLYAQEGPILYRLGGSAPIGSGDPTVDVLAVASEIIPGQASGD